MPGLVALCHFCEFHGPSVIMLTQSIRDCQMPTSDTSDQQSRKAKVEDQCVPEHKLYGCQKLFADDLARRDKGGCEGCWFMESQDSFIISNDHAGKRTYASSKTILNTDLLGLIRHAVIRSISCEISANKEGPILFSDPTVSTVLANNFFLRDSRARGFQRYYSIIVVNKEREHLISNWHNINKAVSDIIEPLKSMAREKYAMETKTPRDLKEKCENFKANSVNRRRGSTKAARNLKDLTMDPNIYETIHGQFVRILTSLEKSLKEKVLSGQPMKSSVIFPKASLETLLKILSQIGLPNFKILLDHLLSGKTLQIKSKLRQLSRRVAESLCMLLPNNLSRNPSYFANLVLATSDMDNIYPQLKVGLEQSPESQFVFKSCSCHRGLTCLSCPHVMPSNFVAKFCKIFSNLKIPKTIQEMSIRSFGEMILLQSRVYMKLKTQSEKKLFLNKNGFTALDEEILNFFKLFS